MANKVNIFYFLKTKHLPLSKISSLSSSSPCLILVAALRALHLDKNNNILASFFASMTCKNPEHHVHFIIHHSVTAYQIKFKFLIQATKIVPSFPNIFFFIILTTPFIALCTKHKETFYKFYLSSHLPPSVSCPLSSLPSKNLFWLTPGFSDYFVALFPSVLSCFIL